MEREPSEIYSLPWREVRHPVLRRMLHWSHRLVERLLGLRKLNRLYDRLKAHPTEGAFPAQILRELEVTVKATPEDEARIPATGPLAVVANHPYGAMEGLALLERVRKRRPDVKVLANAILHRIPELREDMFFVDPFGTTHAMQRNVHALRQSLAWLKAGGALIVFPAGEVASFAPKAFRIRDPQWHTSIMALVHHVGQKVHLLPVFIPGKASLLFHLMGKIHPRLRTLRLPLEMLRLRRHTLELRVGQALSSEELFARFRTDAEALRYLRFRTFLLAGRTKGSKFELQMRRLSLDLQEPPKAPVIPPMDAAAMEQELAQLPPEACLLHSGEFDLYVAQGGKIPLVLREIGRLREITFRAAGEGTGRDQDTDDFDEAYYQVVLWHREERSVVGCYRLALSDVLAETKGLGALYTRTLFRFDERFLGHLPGPAVELGRSFVRTDYQRSFAPLLLLWRGVLTFLARHPRYTVLFGPVSISHDFRPASRELLVEYLHARAYDWTLARYVAARLPPKRPHFVEWRHPDYADFLRTESDVNAALAELEEGRREMPVLIRQYLKLGGRIVALNVDPEFGTVVDGLIVVDLLQAPPRDIARYMGKEAYEAYLHAPRKEAE